MSRTTFGDRFNTFFRVICTQQPILFAQLTLGCLPYRLSEPASQRFPNRDYREWRCLRDLCRSMPSSTANLRNVLELIE